MGWDRLTRPRGSVEGSISSSTELGPALTGTSQIEPFGYFELNRGYLEAVGSSKIHRVMIKWPWCRWNARTGPRCAPKCPSFGPPFGRGPNTRLALHFTISTLFDAFFCSSQLASFSVVPVMPWDARGEPMYTLY